MEKDTFLKLLNKYLSGKATAVEEGLLSQYYRHLDEQSKEELTADEQQAMHGFILQNIMGRIHEAPVLKMRKSFPWYYAAAVLLVLLGGAYLFRPTTKTVQIAKNDILPGRNQDTLTLANSQKIILTKTLNGKLAQQGSTAVNVSASNLVYTSSAVPADGLHLVAG
jgi:transmembrane sensor